MRLSGSGSETVEIDPAEFHDNLGALIGDFLHQAAGRGSDVWPEELWKGMFADQAGAKLKEELTRIWRNFRNSPYTEQAGRCWDEVPFLLKLAPELRVEGRFDRLLQNRAGELVLVDYKTHRVPAERVKEIGVSYFPQLQLYSLAVKALWGRLPDRAVLFFPYPNQGVEVPLDRDSLGQLSAEVKLMAALIEEHDLPGDYPKGGDCRKCGYQWWCRF